MELSFTPLHPAPAGASMIFTVAIVAIAAGLVFSATTVWLYARLQRVRRTAEGDREVAARQLDFRDALLAVDGEALVVLGQQGRCGGAAEMADSLLEAANK